MVAHVIVLTVRACMLPQMLPETELYCPPITIRCMDCRNFGRFVLVGTHVINNIHKFMYTPQLKSKAAVKEGACA